MIPIVFVIYMMLDGMSPSRAVFFTILLFLAIAVVERLIKKDPDTSYAAVLRGCLRDLLLGLEEGALNALVVSAIVGTVGLDRPRVVSGKSVTVSVESGGRRINKK